MSRKVGEKWGGVSKKGKGVGMKGKETAATQEFILLAGTSKQRLILTNTKTRGKELSVVCL